MAFESISDAKISALLSVAKKVTNPGAREADKGSHLQTNYHVKSIDGEDFTLYLRQNKRIDEDFSCGLAWRAPSGDTLTLVRYNGSSHSHPNRMEGTETGFACHIHKATERYVHANLKPEGYAEATDRYETLHGAMHALVSDCHISGIKTQPDHPDLFG